MNASARSVARRFTFSTCVLVALAGCSKSEPAGSPGESVASKPSGSASAVAPLPLSVGSPQCIDGVRIGEVAAEADAGPLPALHVRGQTLRVLGFDVDAVERVVCGGVPRVRKCFDDFPVAVKGVLAVTVVFDSEGKVLASNSRDALSMKTTDDLTSKESLTACIVEAVSTLSFGKPRGEQRSLVYAFDLDWPKPPTLKVSDTGVTIVGTDTPEPIRRVIRANHPRLRACYKSALASQPQLAGKVSTKLEIAPDGSVTATTLPANGPKAITDATMQSCLAAVFRSLPFEKPGAGKVIVTCPLEFAVEP